MKIILCILFSILLTGGFCYPPNYKNTIPYECGRIFNSKTEIENDTKIKAYLNYVKFNAREVVADVGAENGYLDAAMSLFVDSITFYIQDINPVCLNQVEFDRVIKHYSILNGRLIPNEFKIVIGEQDDTRLPDSYFDKIMLNDVIHQLYNPVAFISHLKTKLKKNGTLCVGQYTGNGISSNMIINVCHSAGFSLQEHFLEGNFELYLFEETDKQIPVIDSFFWAVINGDVAIVKNYIEEGKTTVNSTDEAGFSALMYASKYGNLPIVEYLVENGADINYSGKNYQASPLMFAVKNDHTDIFKFLVSKGAGLNVSFEGISPIIYSVQNGNLEITNFLINKGIQYKVEQNGKNLLFFAVSNENSDLFFELISTYKLNPKQTDNFSRSLLMYAVMSGKLELVKFLIEKSHLKVNKPDYWNCSALDYAFSDDIIKYLRSKGAKKGKELL